MFAAGLACSGRIARVAALAALGLAAVARADAQVFQIQGGGSSLFAGYGGLLNVWGNGYEASLGIGYLDGIKVGAAGRRLIARRDTLRLGNDMLPMTLDTDVFNTGGTIFAQGASLQRRRGRTQTWLFAGASASALSAPLFGAQRAVHAMSYARARYDVSRAISVTGHAIATNRQSLLGTVRWEPALGIRTSATLGLGSNAPYGAVAVDASNPHWDVKGALVGIGSGFRRASAPMPLQTELERENLLVNWKPRDGWSLGVGRQHFRQDSAFSGIAQRAALTQITATGLLAGTAFSGGWLVSQAGRSPNVSSYFTGKRDVTPWLQSELYLLRVWQPTQARGTTPVLLLRETTSSRLSLLQAITRDQGRTSVSFGGTLNAGLSSISVDYQVAHSPYLTANPFVQTMGVSARLHVHGFSLSFGSFVTPDGRVHYSAQGNTFVYRGVNGAGGGGGGGRVSGYVASGRVVDESGAPIDGAALEIGGETIYTDSQGRFFVRKPSTRPLVLRVVLDDFLLPGTFEVVEAPAELRPAHEQRVVPVRIVLRRVIQPPADLTSRDGDLGHADLAGAGVDDPHLHSPDGRPTGRASWLDGTEAERQGRGIAPRPVEWRETSPGGPHVQRRQPRDVPQAHGHLRGRCVQRQGDLHVVHAVGGRILLADEQCHRRRSRAQSLRRARPGREQQAEEQQQREPPGAWPRRRGARGASPRASLRRAPAWCRSGRVSVHAAQSRPHPRQNFTLPGVRPESGTRRRRGEPGRAPQPPDRSAVLLARARLPAAIRVRRRHSVLRPGPARTVGVR